MQDPTKAIHSNSTSSHDAADPFLSVIVPVYNSEEDLEKCLTALARSEYEHFDVLVIDDGSASPVESLVRRHEFDCMRIEGPGGPARARNRGAQHVRGGHLVFIDADVCVHPDTLSRFAQRFQSDPNIDAVVGTYDDAPGDPGFLSQYKNLFHHYVHDHSDGDVSTFWSGCGAMRREVFLKMGGFDEQRYRRPAIEDIELGTWATIEGHRIVLDSAVRCQHLKRWTFRGLLKTDILDRGIPWIRLMRRAGGLINTLNVKHNQRISVTLVYLTILMGIGTIWMRALGPAAAGLAVLVTLINLDFYRFFMRRRGAWFTLRVVPLHWLYFAYCGLCVMVGTALCYLKPDPNPRRPSLTSKSVEGSSFSA